MGSEAAWLEERAEEEMARSIAYTRRWVPGDLLLYSFDDTT